MQGGGVESKSLIGLGGGGRQEWSHKTRSDREVGVRAHAGGRCGCEDVGVGDEKDGQLSLNDSVEKVCVIWIP